MARYGMNITEYINSTDAEERFDYPDNWDYTFTVSEQILDYMMREWIIEEDI